MQNSSFVGIAIALGSGVALGIQAIFFTLLGRSVGPFRASLTVHVTGGVIGGIILLGALLIQGRGQWQTTPANLGHAVIAVIMGIFIVMGITIAYQRTGVATGLASLVLGQMIIGIVGDTLGWTGGEPIPLDLRRVLGVIVMLIAIALLVPRR